jgi:hypothetical protein
MKKLIVLLCLLVSFSARPWWCPTFNKALDVGAFTLSHILECHKTDLVKIDLVGWLRYHDFCGETAKESEVCLLIGEAAAKFLADAVPIEWDCKLDLAGRITKESVRSVCEKVVIVNPGPPILEIRSQRSIPSL